MRLKKFIAAVSIGAAIAVAGAAGAASAEAARDTYLSDWYSGIRSAPWADTGTNDGAATRVRLQNCIYTLTPLPTSSSLKQELQLVKQNIIGGWDSQGNKQANCGSWASWGVAGGGTYKFQLNKYTNASGSAWYTACCFAANPVRIEW